LNGKIATLTRLYSKFKNNLKTHLESCVHSLLFAPEWSILHGAKEAIQRKLWSGGQMQAKDVDGVSSFFCETKKSNEKLLKWIILRGKNGREKRKLLKWNHFEGKKRTREAKIVEMK
jgi:hypothetical protein